MCKSLKILRCFLYLKKYEMGGGGLGRIGSRRKSYVGDVLSETSRRSGSVSVHVEGENGRGGRWRPIRRPPRKSAFNAQETITVPRQPFLHLPSAFQTTTAQ